MRYQNLVFQFRNRFVLLFLVLAFILTVVGLKPWIFRAATRMKLASLLDFGDVTPGIHTMQLLLENPQNMDVTVTSIISNCGCTVAKVPVPVKIAAGAQLSLPIQLEVSGSTGPIDKQLVIHTDQMVETKDGTKNLAYRCKVKAFVLRKNLPLAVPSRLNYGKVGNWETKCEDIVITNAGTVPLELAEILVHPPGIETNVIEKSKGHQFEIAICFSPGHETLGEKVLEQKIKTSQGILSIPIEATVVAHPYCIPDVFMIDESNIGAVRSFIIHFPEEVDWGSPVLDCSEGQAQLKDVQVIERGVAKISFQITGDPTAVLGKVATLRCAAEGIQAETRLVFLSGRQVPGKDD
jgi:hypothetical protein